MNVTYEFRCQGCGIPCKETVRDMPFAFAYKPFLVAQDAGVEMCNGCISKMQQISRVVFDQPMTGPRFDALMIALQQALNYPKENHDGGT